MSIKAYNAYKYVGKPCDLIPTLLGYKLRFLKRMIYCISKIMMDKDGNMNSELWKSLSDKFKDISINPERHPLDFTSGIRLFQSKLRKTVIIIPRYEPINNITTSAMKFLSKEPCLREFSYWNNTDKPNHISNKEWTARAKVYRSLDEPLYISWLSTDNFYQVTPLFIGSTHIKRSNEYMEKVKEFKAYNLCF